jgi:hypothetical protein
MKVRASASSGSSKPFGTSFFKALTENLRLRKLEIAVDVDISSSSHAKLVALTNDTYRLTHWVDEIYMAGWAASPWHLLAGTGLKELAIRLTHKSGRSLRNEKSREFVRGVRATIGCGGQDDGAGVKRNTEISWNHYFFFLIFPGRVL